MVTIFSSSFCSGLAQRSITPISRAKFPNAILADQGSRGRQQQNRDGKQHHRKHDLLDPADRRCCFIRIFRTSGVVSARMIGGG